MGITQLAAIKTLPYVISNVMALFTVLPLANAVIAFVNLEKALLNNRVLLMVGTVSYEVYLVHAFTLDLVNGSVFWVGVFIVVTAAFAAALHFITVKLGKTK